MAIVDKSKINQNLQPELKNQRTFRLLNRSDRYAMAVDHSRFQTAVAERVLNNMYKQPANKRCDDSNHSPDAISVSIAPIFWMSPSAIFDSLSIL